jgi:A/G-specific adenine glycosylase
MNFAEILIKWYQNHKRILPWRDTQNAYYIWLSEIILQQTRVVQGLPYYERFVEAFPTVFDLAKADEQDVLRLWQGLGYYSRARNLHQTAKIIVSQYQGIFPQTYQALLQLKGIGTYTAAAIASFAFDEKVAVLDGNVYRVLSRVFGIETDISSNDAKKVFTKIATELLPTTQANVYNQAIMEFGAIQCVPQSPRCMFCPLNIECIANQQNRQSVLPIKTKKVKIRERYFYYFVIEDIYKKLWMKKRPLKDIWAEMYDFYLKESEHETTIEELIVQDVVLKSVVEKGILNIVDNPIIHILTHQRINTSFIHIVLKEKIENELIATSCFYELSEIEDLPKSTLINNYLKEYFFS